MRSRRGSGGNGKRKVGREEKKKIKKIAEKRQRGEGRKETEKKRRQIEKEQRCRRKEKR